MFARVTECILQILIMEYIIDCVRVDARWNVPMFMVSFCPVASGFSTESKYTHTKSRHRRLNSLFHWFHPYSLLSERNISFIHIYIVFINVYGVFYVIISLFLYRWQHHARSSLQLTEKSTWAKEPCCDNEIWAVLWAAPAISSFERALHIACRRGRSKQQARPVHAVVETCWWGSEQQQQQ